MDDSIRIRAATSRADLDACVSLQRAVWGLSDLEIDVDPGAHRHPSCRRPPAPRRDRRRKSGRLCLRVPRHPRRRRPPALGHAGRACPGTRSTASAGGSSGRSARTRCEPGVGLITWTYDPLQARNANLNLHRLGATAMEFLDDFYGVTTSSLHHDMPTDRLLVHWELRSPRVEDPSRRASHRAGAGPRLPAHQRGEVAGRLAGVVRAPPRPATRPRCSSRCRRTGTCSRPARRTWPRIGSPRSKAFTLTSRAATWRETSC